MAEPVEDQIARFLSSRDIPQPPAAVFSRPRLEPPVTPTPPKRAMPPSNSRGTTSVKRARVQGSHDASLQDGILSIFHSGAYSDLTIRDRHGQELRVHKNIVCTRCKFFAKAVDGGFKEGKSGLVEMSNDDPDAVRALLEWLYSDAYTTPNFERLRDTALFHLEIYIIAEIYGVVVLAEKAMEEFTKIVGLQKWHCPREIIPTAAERIYESVPEKQGGAIKRALASASAFYLPCLLQSEKFTEQMADNPTYAREVGKALRDLPKAYRNFECDDCNEASARASRRRA